jgi:hypothetical protein
MYNYMSFWTIALLCLIFSLLFHGVGHGLSALEHRLRDKKRRADIEQDKKEAMEMVNALKRAINSSKPTSTPGGGGPVS